MRYQRYNDSISHHLFVMIIFSLFFYSSIQEAVKDYSYSVNHVAKGSCPSVIVVANCCFAASG